MADRDIHGIAVHIAARIMAFAAPGEVLVSGVIPPLVLGSRITFADRGSHHLKGVPDRWPVLAVRDSSAWRMGQTRTASNTCIVAPLAPKWRHAECADQRRSGRYSQGLAGACRTRAPISAGISSEPPYRRREPANAGGSL
jgi:hypothetical protein